MTTINTLSDLASLADYSLMESFNADLDADLNERLDGEQNGANHSPREVYSGHYVPVTPMPIENSVSRDQVLIEVPFSLL